MRKKKSFLSNTGGEPDNPNVIKTTVKQKLDKRKGKLNELTRDEKLIRALRLALSSKSGELGGARYYLDGDQVYVQSRGGGAQSKPGEMVTYTASGRMRIGAAHPKHAAFHIAEFRITYRDVLDERGIPSVAFIDPTVITLLPSNSKLILT